MFVSFTAERQLITELTNNAKTTLLFKMTVEILWPFGTDGERIENLGRKWKKTYMDGIEEIA